MADTKTTAKPKDFLVHPDTPLDPETGEPITEPAEPARDEFGRPFLPGVAR